MSKRKELEGFKKPNWSAIFVLPMCEINYRTFPLNFINTYLNFEEEIVVIFKKPREDNNSFMQYVDYLKLNKNYSGYSQIEDEFIMFFRIPERNKVNYTHFLNGKYSQFSKDYKKLLEGYYGVESRKQDYEVYEYNVIHPENFKRQQIADRLGVDVSLINEVLDPPNLNKEEYKSINQLIEQSFNKLYDNKQQDSLEHNDI